MGHANTATRYGSITKGFHWLTALLILTVIPLGLIAKDMALDLLDPQAAPTADAIARATLVFSLHKTVGVAIFFTALARIAWAIADPAPGPIAPGRRAEIFLARTVHWLLYVSLLLVPLTGWAVHSTAPGFAPILWPLGQSLPILPASPEAAELFTGLHITFERVLVLALLLHVAGALKHHFWDRDATLARMWPGGGDGPTAPPARQGPAPLIAALAVWGTALALGATLGLFATDGRDRSIARPPPGAASGAPSSWQVQDGTLDITITQLGTRVSGQFRDWEATITFDETIRSGVAGHVSVTVATDSLTLGPVTAQAKGPDFLDSARQPVARFQGDIIATETGWLAPGRLELRGVTAPLDLPFDLSLDGNSARMTATTRLNRLDYGIGITLPDPASLGLEVEIGVTLTARRTGQGD